MIATILPGSSNFHAVGYNEHKVEIGAARLLEIRNFGGLEALGDLSEKDLRGYLNDYSSRNSRIKKAQFHVAISCKGNEATEEELLDFAHRYLKEMGYGENGQPLLIYLHNDTANRHIHIITSRVRPDGKKIDHNHERRRSQEVIAKLMGENLKKNTRSDIEKVLGYSFQSLAQFRAILSSMGYETYEDNENSNLNIKKGGSVKGTLPVSKIIERFTESDADKKRRKQLRGILKKYRDLSVNSSQLQKDLKEKFGIDIVFFGKKDRPQAYFLIDHKEKVCYNGSTILRLAALLDFGGPDKKLDQVETLIKKQLLRNPKTTTHELFRAISKSGTGAFLKRDGNLYIVSGNERRAIDATIEERLGINNRIETIERFHPRTESEKSLLCRIYNIDEDRDLVNMSSTVSPEYHVALYTVSAMFSQFNGSELRSALRSEGFVIKRDGENIFAINLSRKIIIDLQKENLEINRLWPSQKYSVKDSIQHNSKQYARYAGRVSAGNPGKGNNREWEVGRQNDSDSIDDKMESSKLRY